MTKEVFNKIKNWLLEMEITLHYESPNFNSFVISKESDGIKNMVIIISSQILIVEQFLFLCNNPTLKIYQKLLQKNRDIVHGAFVLDETSKKVIFRNTLQTENLDKNELISTINSMSLLLSEFSNEIIEMSN